LGTEVEDRPPRERSFDPVHFRERRLVGRRDLEQPQQSIELGAGVRLPAGAQGLQRGIEMRLGLAGRLGTEPAHLLEVTNRAIGLTEPEERIREL